MQVLGMRALLLGAMIPCCLRDIQVLMEALLFQLVLELQNKIGKRAYSHFKKLNFKYIIDK